MIFDLKSFRTSLNLKQSDLQEILGVTQSFISKIENGKESFPIDYIGILSERFGGDVVKKYIIDRAERSFSSHNIIVGNNNRNISTGGGSQIINESFTDLYRRSTSMQPNEIADLELETKRQQKEIDYLNQILEEREKAIVYLKEALNEKERLIQLLMKNV